MLKIVLCIFVATHTVAQQTVPSQNLTQKNYDFYKERLERLDISNSQKITIANEYVQNAKKLMDLEEMANAYKELLHLSNNSAQFHYADSIIYASSRTNNDVLKAEAYITKGNLFYGKRKYPQAWDNYIMAEVFVIKTDDSYLYNNLKFNKAQIKYYMGFWEEAMGLFKECALYFEKEDDGRPYLSSLHALSLCYYKTYRNDLCSTTTALGISKAMEQDDHKMVSYFIYTEGINQYFKKNYEISLTKLSEALPVIVANNDFANEMLINLYQGKCHWDQNKFEMAISFFEKVDKSYVAKKHITSELRQNFELLLKFWSDKKNKTKQILYINRLLQIDSILSKNSDYLTSKTPKELDTKQLLKMKSSLEEESITKNGNIVIGLIIILSAIVIFLASLQLQTKFKLKRKFHSALSKTKKSKKGIIAERPDNLSDIKLEAIQPILKHLEKFEKEKIFLKPGMTLQKMAKMFETNTTYLPRIILHYKGKKNNDYVNDLKIEYIVQLLKDQPKHRQYSLRALADECGFNSIQHFTSAFEHFTGFKPSTFIKKLGDKLYSDSHT